MQLIPLAFYRTRRGVAVIAFNRQDGRFHACFDGEDLGGYHTAQQAAGDLSGGYTVWPAAGDPSTFGIPDDISEWSFVGLN